MYPSKSSRYEDLFLQMLRCEKCFPREEKLLLPGTGNIDSKIVCIGEAPSKHRDFNETFGMKSKPIFEEFLKACSLSRKDVWVTNVVKCIVLHKKVGDPEKCKEFLFEELDIIQPCVVVLFGKTSVKYVLGKNYKFGKVVRTLDRTYCCVPHPMTVIYGTYTLEQYLKFADSVRKVLEELK